MAANRTLNDSPLGRAYAVILAGGSGTRFWPLSRRKRPKQLLELFGRGTLLEQTLARLEGTIPSERIYIFTNELIQGEIVQRLPAIPREQIVAEPAARNTAPTIGLAAHEICRRDADGLMVVLPSDHVITKQAEFIGVLGAGCRFATKGRLVTVGLKPTEPHTGYGYVRMGSLAERSDGQEVFQVLEFVEKPDLPTARRYVDSGQYLWNGGMFIWRASTLLHNLEKLQPAMAGGLAEIARNGGVGSVPNLRRLYPGLEKISIDYAVMEKASDVFVIAADIGWSDVGSWSVAYDLHDKDEDGQVRPAHSLSMNSRGNMIFSPKKYVVTVGVDDLIIVETEDALLVCKRQSSQDVGKAVQEIERLGLSELL